MVEINKNPDPEAA